MKTLGKPLLRKGQFLSKYLDILPAEAAELARSMMLYEHDLTLEKIRGELEGSFRLEPITIGTLKSVLVYTQRRGFRTADGVRHGYVAEARVPYSGSPILWSARPSASFSLPYKGVVAKASIGLRGYWPSKDLTDFETEVQEHLIRLREALTAFAPTVAVFNEHIQKTIDMTITALFHPLPQ